MASLKSLIVRANRLLGASLVEKGLVSIDDLDEANDRLSEFVSSCIFCLSLYGSFLRAQTNYSSGTVLVISTTAKEAG